MNYIGLSGLNAAEILLNNTAHNVANAETPWFSRRRPLLVAEQSHWGGLLSQLGGVRVLSLVRLSDTYLNDQVFRATASQSSANALMMPLMQMDQLLGNDDTGLTGVLTQFVGDLQRCETRPESIPLRQQWLGSTRQLVTRFQMLNQQLLSTAEQQIRQVSNLVTGVNQLTGAIAALNDEIAELSGLSDIYGGGNCADLMDQRDALINQLSEQLSIEVDRQSNNSVNLLVVSEQGAIPLVSGQQYFQLSLGSGGSDPLAPPVLVNVPGTAVPITPRDGLLAGLQSFHSDGLMLVINQLGLMAAVLAAQVNNQQTEGWNLAGAVGAPLFQAVNSATAMQLRAVAESVTGSGKLSVAISDLTALLPSEYQLLFTAADQCRVIRLSDGQVFTGTLDAQTPFTVDGLVISMTGTPAVGDQYLLMPWRNEVRQLSLAVDSPSAVAFAATGQGPGDNQNLLSLLSCLQGDSASCPALMQKNIMLQSSVANKTSSAVQQQLTSESLYQAAVAERASLSGVNLDEEAANLMRFQQYYQANAQVLRSSQIVLDELLALYR